jgi:hypothetical protein
MRFAELGAANRATGLALPLDLRPAFLSSGASAGNDNVSRKIRQVAESPMKM